MLATTRRSAGGRQRRQYPIVHLEQFIQSVRDVGYRGTPYTVAELIDNALQSNARDIRVFTSEGGRLDADDGYIAVLDDGAGMDETCLRAALQFGGSSRFDDREGLGRFGMGLPSSSFSRARHLTVYTWQRADAVFACSLDFDKIVQGRTREVPQPVARSLPERFRGMAKPHGTLVLWTRCDRLELVRPSTLEQHLQMMLGRVFRFFLLDRRSISVNGKPVRPIDPLLLDPRARSKGATPYGQPMSYSVAIPNSRRESLVEVRFSELPIEDWYRLPNVQKRSMGIVKGAGVSIVRAGREIDYGWFFTGGKRKENYDDWWRCEVRFQPEIDELFGVTYTKQGIHPTELLNAILTPDIERVARKLNARVRGRFVALKSHVPTPAENAAMHFDRYLRPLPAPKGRHHDRRISRLGINPPQKHYSVVVRALKEPAFFLPLRVGRKIVVVVNRDHPFFARVYEPLTRSEGSNETRKQLELLLLAAARAEMTPKSISIQGRRAFRDEWGKILATFLGS